LKSASKITPENTCLSFLFTILKFGILVIEILGIFYVIWDFGRFLGDLGFWAFGILVIWDFGHF
jgi:hypothetical protein